MFLYICLYPHFEMNTGIEINNYNYALNEEFAYLDELQKEVNEKLKRTKNSQEELDSSSCRLNADPPQTFSADPK